MANRGIIHSAHCYTGCLNDDLNMALLNPPAMPSMHTIYAVLYSTFAKGCNSTIEIVELQGTTSLELDTLVDSIK